MVLITFLSVFFIAGVTQIKSKKKPFPSAGIADEKGD